MRNYFPLVQQIALSLPGVYETISHGSTIFKVKDRFLTALKDDGITLVLRIGDMAERDMMLETEPDIFFITDHYKPWPGLLVRLSCVTDEGLRRLIEHAWRRNAPKKLVKAYDEQR